MDLRITKVGTILGSNGLMNLGESRLVPVRDKPQNERTEQGEVLLVE